MKKSTQKVLDPKKDVLTRLKHLRALLGEARRGRGRAPAGIGRGSSGCDAGLGTQTLRVLPGGPLSCKLTPSPGWPRSRTAAGRSPPQQTLGVVARTHRTVISPPSS